MFWGRVYTTFFILTFTLSAKPSLGCESVMGSGDAKETPALTSTLETRMDPFDFSAFYNRALELNVEEFVITTYPERLRSAVKFLQATAPTQRFDTTHVENLTVSFGGRLLYRKDAYREELEEYWSKVRYMAHVAFVAKDIIETESFNNITQLYIRKYAQRLNETKYFPLFLVTELSKHLNNPNAHVAINWLNEELISR